MALGMFLLLGIAGLVDDSGTSVALVFLQYVAQLVAGYVGGRIAGSWRILNGSLAAEVLFVVSAGTSVAAGGSPGPVALVSFAAVALVIGAAGGALAEWRARERPANP